MKPLRPMARRGRCSALSVGWLLFAGLVPLACASAEENGTETNEELTVSAAGEPGTAGSAQEVPVCRFTASGEELTGRVSPPDSTSVTLGDATAKLCYSAPSMRGRSIMGGLVPYGEPWRTGANEPTTLHLPFAAEVGGVRLEPGSYALYTIPGPAEWTIVLNAAPDRWGIPIDEEVRAADIGSFTVQTEALEQPVERLSIEMEPIDEGSARVVLEWERTRVSFPIRRVEG